MNYILISGVMTVATIIRSYNMNSKSDSIEKFDNTLYEREGYLKSIKKKSLTMGNFLEKVHDKLMKGNDIAVIIFFFMMYLVPVFRWCLLISMMNFFKQKELKGFIKREIKSIK